MRPIPHSMPLLGTAEEEAVARAVRSGFLGTGPATAAFEAALAAACERKWGIAVQSGTLALELALRALGVGAGDSVLVPAYVCASVPHAVLNVGARPLAVDIGAVDLAMDAESAARVAGRVRQEGRRVGAVIAVHAFGFPCDIASLSALGAPVIEDCATSTGARVGSRVVGGEGTVSVFSFGSIKMMTTGGGGMLLGDDAGLRQRTSALLDYDSPQESAAASGWRANGRMTDVAASIGMVQLERLPELLSRRESLAARYTEALAGSGCGLPLPREGTAPAWFRYVVRTRAAAGVAAGLKGIGIGLRTDVADWFHERFPASGVSYPVASEVRGTLLSLPIYPAMSDDDSARVAASVLGALGGAP